MNQLEKERIEKIKGQILAQKRLGELQKDLRRKNEQQLQDKLGVRETLTEFHKPVTEQLAQQEVSRNEQMKAVHKAVQDAMQEISIPSLESTRIPELEYGIKDLERTIYNLNLNKDLDESFIRKEGFELPSELVSKSEGELNEIIKRANDRNKEFGTRKGPIKKEWMNVTEDNGDRKEYLRKELAKYDHKIQMMRNYTKALKTLRGGHYYTGEGIDGMELLSRLTDKRCSGSKSKKLYNKIVNLLDTLLKKGELTNDFVKSYYAKFLS